MKYINIFDDFQKASYKEKDYNNFNSLYNHILGFYLLKIKNDKMDIKIEKMIIEKRIGKYSSESSKFSITFLIGIASALLPLYIQSFVELNNRNKAVVMLCLVCFSFFMIVKSIGKDINHDKDKDIVYNVSIKVLEELDKRGSDTPNEVAGSLDITNKKIEKLLEE